MTNANELVRAMKRASKEEREASKPVNVFFGEVQGVNPLKINVEQKMLLGEAQLVLSRNVTDFITMATVQWETEEEEDTHYHKITGQADSEIQSLKHTHVITGKRQITIHNALDVGDEVILIRQQEGQKFIVADRIGGRR